jgi:hypothetical protein
MNWTSVVQNTEITHSDIESNVSSDDEDFDEIKITRPKIKYNSYYVIDNILRTPIRNPIFEDWEFAYFPYLLDMFIMMSNCLKTQDFDMNAKNAKLFRKFNKLIFRKSSKYIVPYINQDYLDDYKNYLCQVEQ